jgi:hypothetical protein
MARGDVIPIFSEPPVTHIVSAKKGHFPKAELSVTKM